MATQLIPLKSGANQGAFLGVFSYGDKKQYTGFKVNVANRTSVWGRNKTVGRFEKTCSYTAWSLKELNQLFRDIFHMVVGRDSTSNGYAYYMTADYKETPVGVKIEDGGALYYFEALKGDDSIDIKGEGFLVRKYSLITLKGCGGNEELYHKKVETMGTMNPDTKRMMWIDVTTGERGDSPDRPAGAEFYSFTYVPVQTEDDAANWKPWGRLQELVDEWRNAHSTPTVVVVKKEESTSGLIDTGANDEDPFSDENTENVVNISPEDEL